MTAPLLGCIADDFTGATDLANNLVRAGMRAVQTIGVLDGPLADPVDAVVVALKSRTIPAVEAVARSLEALRWLQAQGVEQVYFKYCSTFDSTPAGNIGPVTDALLDALHGPDRGFTIACPAFPENRRTVYKGHLFAGDALLSESGMEKHPLTPMTDPNLVRVLQRQSRRRVGLVDHAVVGQGAAALRERYAELQREGIGIAIVDAISNDDLLSIGASLAGMPLVTAGSGVAIGLPQNWRAGGRLVEGRADALPPAGGLRAIVSGSCSSATQGQVRAFVEAGLPMFQVDPAHVAAGEDVVDAALRWAGPLLSKGPVLVSATTDPQGVKASQDRLGVAAAGELVERTLAAVAAGLVASGVRQLVVAGGETSGAVVQALGIRQMKIGAQIDPGVPWTSARTADGILLHLALKSGNFGSPDFFAKSFGRLA